MRWGWRWADMTFNKWRIRKRDKWGHGGCWNQRGSWLQRRGDVYRNVDLNNAQSRRPVSLKILGFLTDIFSYQRGTKTVTKLITIGQYLTTLWGKCGVLLFWLTVYIHVIITPNLQVCANVQRESEKRLMEYKPICNTFSLAGWMENLQQSNHCRSLHTANQSINQSINHIWSLTPYK